MDVKMRRGCPSTPSACCRPNSHSTDVVSTRSMSLDEVCVVACARASCVNALSAISTDSIAAIESTRWKWPTTKYESWYTVSIDAEDSAMPVKPPSVKHISSASKLSRSAQIVVVLHAVDVQVNSLTAVGTAMIMVDAEKNSLLSSAIPATYMWCAQTKKPIAPMARIARSIPA